MMFRIVPASLAVLAIFNVASTLADSNFNINFTVKPLGAVISDPQFIYGDGSGCGGSNAQCSCTVPSVGPDEGKLIMLGVGSESTATGLDFSCSFYARKLNSPLGSAVKCSLHIDLPYTLGSNSISCDCAGYTFYGCDISSGGHRFVKTLALSPNDLQLDDELEGSTCEADLAQCDVDKTLNAVSVLSKLQSGSIKLVFGESA